MKRCLVVLVILLSFLAKTKSVWAYEIADLKADLEFLGTVTMGKLLFDPFGSNPDPNFAKHRLDDQQIDFLCDSDCGAKNIGVNFGTFYKGGNYERARKNKMNWSLEIAQPGSAQAIADIINNENISNVIVRIGVAGSGSFGFDDPNAYAAFLADIASKVGGKTFYAIAGPNEPDIETWATPGCNPPNGSDPPSTRAAFYECVGPKLANYMNSVIAQKPGNVKLLSPAFNLTSFMFNDDTGQADGIPLAMLRHGANFAGLDAVAGNIYPNGDSMQNIWNNHVATVVAKLGKPVVITETGPWSSVNQPFEGYDLSIYNDYDTDDKEFYLQPIKGLGTNPGTTKDKNQAVIRTDLIDQGYQAFCATPKYEATASIGPSDIVNLFVNKLGRSTELKFESTQLIDFTKVQTPLWRDVRDKQFLFTSIEEFWGFKDTVIEENTAAEINSAPVNSLLSNQQRCQASVKILLEQETMCEKLENPDSCVLYKRTIPETDYTIKTLLDEYKNLVNTPPVSLTLASSDYKDEDVSKQICNELLNSDWNSTAAQGLLYTPLNIDRIYRPAFLVISVEQIPKVAGKLYNFFRDEGSTDHAVLAVAFKVPDVGTNKRYDQSSLSNTGHTSWEDPLALSDSILSTGQQKEKSQKLIDEFFSRLKVGAEEASQNPQDSSNLIRCNPNTAQDACGDKLGAALIDLINGQNKDSFGKAKMLCNENTVEPSSEIVDEGTLLSQNPPGEQTNFKADLDLGNQLIDSLLPESDQAVFKSNWDVNSETWKNQGASQIAINFYLVYPAGMELEAVEQTLSATFFTQDELSDLNQNPLKKQGFSLQDTEQKLDGDGQSFSFTDPTDCEWKTRVVLGIEIPYQECKEKSFSGAVDSIVQDPTRILGGGLGFWMRVIQLNLHELVSVSRDYLATCKTTEQFLLGQCSGADVAPRYSDEEPPIDAEEGPYCGIITDWITNQSGNFSICKGGNCAAGTAEMGEPGYFVDSSSSLKIRAKSFIADGATLVTTNSIIPMNPGQAAARRCGSSGGARIRLLFIPQEEARLNELNNVDYWTGNAYHLIYTANQDASVNLILSINVKPGYYRFQLQTSGCFMGTILRLDKNGNQISNSNYFTMNENSFEGQQQYCSQMGLNSNMPGGYEEKVSEARGCTLDNPYDLSVNTHCGGLRGTNKDEGKDGWDGAIPLSPEGLIRYQSIFRRAFTRPAAGSPYMCQDLFPNVIAEVDCDQLTSVGTFNCLSVSHDCGLNTSCITDIDSYCATEYLEPKIATYLQKKGISLSTSELSKRATEASIICQRESGGNAGSLNTGCVSGKTLDYSVGLFQINLLAHDCHETFLDYGIGPPPFCVLDESQEATDKRAECVSNLSDPDTNIQRMLEISNGGSNWYPWSAARVCGIVE